MKAKERAGRNDKIHGDEHLGRELSKDDLDAVWEEIEYIIWKHGRYPTPQKAPSGIFAFDLIDWLMQQYEHVELAELVATLHMAQHRTQHALDHEFDSWRDKMEKRLREYLERQDWYLDLAAEMARDRLEEARTLTEPDHEARE